MRLTSGEAHLWGIASWLNFKLFSLNRKILKAFVRLFHFLFCKTHNCSLGIYVSEVCASWKMTSLRIELTKPAPDPNAPTMYEMSACHKITPIISATLVSHLS